MAIAGALAMEPQVLELDEPGALLDVRGRRGIMRVMNDLHATGTTIVHVTHFMEEALAADRVVVMCQGRIAMQGTPQEVFAHGEELARMGLEEPFAGCLAELLRARGVRIPWTCDEDELFGTLAGLLGQKAPARRHGAAPSPSKQHVSRASCVDARSVGYTYGDTDAREAKRAALQDVTFVIPEGSLTSIVGQTGSGKSTLLRLLCALEAPDAGTLVVDGVDTGSRRMRQLLHGRVGYVMQHPERQLFAETVWEDVAYGPTNLGLSAQEIDQRCRDALALVGLTGREQTSPFHLSGGLQRLCALAGILAMEPSVLVLDEPTAGLDPHGRAQLRAIIERIHKRGTTVIQVTHSMADAAATEQVIALNDGTVLMQGTPAEVFGPATAQTLHSCGLGIPSSLDWALRLTEQTGTDLGEPLVIDALADALLDHIAPAAEEASHGL